MANYFLPRCVHSKKINVNPMQSLLSQWPLKSTILAASVKVIPVVQILDVRLNVPIKESALLKTRLARLPKLFLFSNDTSIGRKRSKMFSDGLLLPHFF